MLAKCKRTQSFANLAFVTNSLDKKSFANFAVKKHKAFQLETLNLKQNKQFLLF